MGMRRTAALAAAMTCVASTAVGQASTASAAEGSSAPAAAPQEPSELEFFQLSEEMNKETKIASGHSEKVQETAGVITIITREEIINSGARDLIDVLQLVPGFSAVGVDVEGVTDFGFRGIWAHEGKILFMIDGQPMNEMLFDDNAFGHHYPIEQIERIEIIRGPGSVLYGGWAELAVINVITRDARQLNGVSGSVYYGQGSGAPSLVFGGTAYGQADLNLAIGQPDVGGIKGLDVTAWLYWGRGTRSTGTYTDFYGDSYSMVGNADLDPFMLSLAVNWKDLHLRFIYDHYHMTEADSYNQADGWGAPAVGSVYPEDEWWITTIVDGSYDLKLGNLTLTPRFTYKRQQPWRVPDQAASNDFFDVTVERFTARLTLNWRILDELNILVGTEDYYEDAWLNQMPAPGSPTLDYFGAEELPLPSPQPTTYSDSNLALFAEGQYRSIVGNLTLGARYEHNSVFGDSFVPRAALTKAIDRFHFKLLFSDAFRSPGIEDVNYSLPATTLQIHPERTQDAEMEVGYQFTDHIYAGLNLFDIVIRDPIIYTFSGSGGQNENYLNFPKTGTQGAELELRVRYRWGFVNANYSYYSAWSIFADAAKNDVPLYAVPNNDSLLAGFPAHKVSLNAHYVVWQGLSVNASGNFLSPRYGLLSEYHGVTASNGSGVPGYAPPLFLLNLYVAYSDLGVKGLDVGLGVYDILNQEYDYLQPYLTGHAPIPGQNREVVARLAYTFPL
jgi:outer membrane receptor protein involved in Fe transport